MYFNLTSEQFILFFLILYVWSLFGFSFIYYNIIFFLGKKTDLKFKNTKFNNLIEQIIIHYNNIISLPFSYSKYEKNSFLFQFSRTVWYSFTLIYLFCIFSDDDIFNTIKNALSIHVLIIHMYFFLMSVFEIKYLNLTFKKKNWLYFFLIHFSLLKSICSIYAYFSIITNFSIKLFSDKHFGRLFYEYLNSETDLKSILDMYIFTSTSLTVIGILLFFSILISYLIIKKYSKQ